MKKFTITGIVIVLAIIGLLCWLHFDRPKHSSSLVQDLGVIDFTDSTSTNYSLGGDKSCAIAGVTNPQGITIAVVFAETNADKTVRVLGTRIIPVNSSQGSYMVSAGDVAVRFTPKFKTP